MLAIVESFNQRVPKGTEFGAYLERGDVHDVVISRDGRQLEDLPAGSRIGGMDTRIKKLDAGRGSVWSLG